MTFKFEVEITVSNSLAYTEEEFSKDIAYALLDGGYDASVKFLEVKS